MAADSRIVKAIRHLRNLKYRALIQVRKEEPERQPLQRRHKENSQKERLSKSVMARRMQQTSFLKQKKDFNNLVQAESLIKTCNERILNTIHKSSAIASLIRQHQISEDTIIKTILTDKLLKACKDSDD
eukprot:TRINITY_DN1153_c0_g1_i4.p1 TRINITY_DN1153_c0_g1~~TRINITY_DN1153_c0_g1_i4.p1  ORF type:complete len:129 (-),score=2.56 TRINITY_DN1153_c0_g1_i4:387-773(-)